MEYFMWLPILTAVETILKIFASMTVIIVGFKLAKALDIYNHKNGR